MAEQTPKTPDLSGIDHRYVSGYYQGRVEMAKDILTLIGAHKLAGPEVTTIAQATVDMMADAMNAGTASQLASASSGDSGASKWSPADVALLIVTLAAVVGGCFGLYSWVF